MSAHEELDPHVEVDRLTLAEELIHRGNTATPEVAEYALWLGDDALILAQRLGDWFSRAPELEEDMAIGNIALDLIGHARSLYHYAGSALKKTEDEIAYFRNDREYRCAHIVQQPNGDYAHTIVRQLIVSAYMFELYTALTESEDPTLAAIAEKSLKEVTYHLDHARLWVVRFALGTDESRERLLVALTDMWPYVDELFHDHPLTDGLKGIAPAPSTLQPGFDKIVAELFTEAQLEVPHGHIAMGGGRDGTPSEHLGHILAEMQVLAREYPGAKW